MSNRQTAIPTTSLALAEDLLQRTEIAFTRIARLAIDTGVTFRLGDVVQLVEDDLPPGYPTPTAGPERGVPGRRTTIAQMASDLLHGRV